MNVKRLLEKQTIRICDHRRCTIHEWNDDTSDIHLHKAPNHGKKFHGIIRVPLHGEPSFEIEKDIKGQFSSAKKYREIQQRILSEIREAFSDMDAGMSKQNFIHNIVDVLHNDWNDKLSSEERAKDVTMKIAYAFGILEEAERIIKETQHELLIKYTSVFKEEKKSYFLSIMSNEILIGEIFGKYKNI